MTQEEIIKHLHEALNSVDITFPYRYVLVEAIEALSQPSLPSNMDNAAEEYAENTWMSGENWADAARRTFKAGAEWGMNQCPLPEDTVIFQKGVEEGKRLMMEEMDEEAYEEVVQEDYQDEEGIHCSVSVGMDYNPGDIVLVNTRKKEGKK